MNNVHFNNPKQIDQLSSSQVFQSQSKTTTQAITAQAGKVDQTASTALNKPGATQTMQITSHRPSAANEADTKVFYDNLGFGHVYTPPPLGNHVIEHQVAPQELTEHEVEILPNNSLHVTPAKTDAAGQALIQSADKSADSAKSIQGRAEVLSTNPLKKVIFKIFKSLQRAGSLIKSFFNKLAELTQSKGSKVKDNENAFKRLLDVLKDKKEALKNETIFRSGGAEKKIKELHDRLLSNPNSDFKVEDYGYKTIGIVISRIFDNLNQKLKTEKVSTKEEETIKKMAKDFLEFLKELNQTGVDNFKWTHLIKSLGSHASLLDRFQIERPEGYDPVDMDKLMQEFLLKHSQPSVMKDI